MAGFSLPTLDYRASACGSNFFSHADVAQAICFPGFRVATPANHESSGINLRAIQFSRDIAPIINNLGCRTSLPRVYRRAKLSENCPLYSRHTARRPRSRINLSSASHTVRLAMEHRDGYRSQADLFTADDANRQGKPVPNRRGSMVSLHLRKTALVSSFVPSALPAPKPN